MKPVLCFGEALIDFLQQDNIEQDKLTLPAFRQYPGGAPANAAVAVAKLGGDARFAGQVGRDSFGDFLEHSLKQYGVDTRLLARHPSAKTALAFVALDDSGDRSFSFYRDNSADVVFSIEQISDDWFSQQPLLHFCSNTLTNDNIATTTKHIVAQAKSKKSLVSFDVNLRHNLWQKGMADRSLVNSLVLKSDLVKFSKDELLYLANGKPKEYIALCLQHQCRLLVVTDGENDIHFHMNGHNGRISPPAFKAVDTTAGGDGFVGGMLFLLSQNEDPFEVLQDVKMMEVVLRFASCCGALAVSLPGAFPALPDKQTAIELYQKLGFDNHTLSTFVRGHTL